MKGDFTRRTFQAGNHYRGVLLQQGRVAMDADWNEQVEIQQHLDEATARDTVGRHGGPAGTAGFAIVAAADGETPRACAPGDLVLTAGRYYVQGVLCENDADVPLQAQPDLPGVPLPEQDGRYVAYLDVRHEHLTALERPALREVALGGPDTATRSRTLWQVRLDLVPDPQVRPTDVAPPWTPPDSVPTGRLRARAEPGADATDPCVIPPAAGYRRLENQLYRVEMHDGGSFLWSRENGSVTARVLGLAADPGDPATVTLTVDSPGRDAGLGFAKGDWVELTDLDRTRRGEAGLLGRLDDVSADRMRVTDWTGSPPDAGTAPSATAVVRRWDSPGAVPVASGWLPLEDGVQVQFEDGGSYRTGDYWLIPARTAALADQDVDSDLVGTVQWPRAADGGPAFQPPDGVDRYTAAVALLDLRDGRWTRLYDCRALFSPLVEARPEPPAPAPTGLHVEYVRLVASGADLRNDTAVSLVDLLGGLVVGLDGPAAPVALTGRPVLTVALDLPYPLADTDRTAWGLTAGQALGTQPLSIAAAVEVAGTELRWLPDGALAPGLTRMLLQVLNQQLGTRVFCRLTVEGRAVRHADHPDRALNGLTTTTVRSEDQGIDVILPSLDDVRGADFTMWCWVDLYRGGIFDISTFDSESRFW
jgi:hypothetical protein